MKTASTEPLNAHSSELELTKPLNGDVVSERTESKFQRFRQFVREWPKCVFCIVGNEFCERFSYFGMSAVLTLYLVNVVGYAQPDALAFRHGYSLLIQLSPLIASVLADGFMGRFRLILWASLIHALGSCILAVSAGFKPSAMVHPWMDFLALFIIAIPTGSIKACVSPFGGDQFKKGQENLLAIWFLVYYFTVNVGAAMSTLITPVLRDRSCLGVDTCFPLAFGVPAVLMVIACVSFVIGARWYRKFEPKGNVVIDVSIFLWVAIRNKIRFRSSINRPDWLLHGLDKHECDKDARCGKTCAKLQLAKDIRSVFRISILFLPLPFYFAMGSVSAARWIFEAMNMNGQLTSDPDGPKILPDQMLAFNPILILIIIPTMATVVYPVVGLCVKLTPLRKMCCGLVIASLGFVAAGFSQLQVNKTMPVIPDHGRISFALLNGENTSVSVHVPGVSGLLVNETMDNMTSYYFEQIEWKPDLQLQLEYSTGERLNYTLPNTGDRSAHIILLENSQFYNDSSRSTDCSTGYRKDCMLKKSTKGSGFYKLNVLFGDVRQADGEAITNGTLHLCEWRRGECTTRDKNFPDKYRTLALDEILNNTHTGWLELKPGKFAFFIDVDNVDIDFSKPNFYFESNAQGGIFSMGIWGRIDNLKTLSIRTAPDNSVHILWQIPQYLGSTVSEVLFSVTGYELCYSQAPFSMKTIVQTIFLLTSAFSEVILIILALGNFFDNDAYIYFTCACVGGCVFLVFGLMSACWYEYNDYVFDDKDDATAKTDDGSVEKL